MGVRFPRFIRDLTKARNAIFPRFSDRRDKVSKFHRPLPSIPQRVGASVILILIRSSPMCHTSMVGTLRHTYLFNNFTHGIARRGDLIASNVDATPYESQSVIIRKYHVVSIRIERRRKEIFGVIFQSAGVPTLCTYVSSGREPRMDNRRGGGWRGLRDREGRRRRYFMGTGFYCARLLGHLLREACL